MMQKLVMGYHLICQCLLQVLLSRIIFFGAKDMPTVENLDLQMYRKTAELVMCGLLPDSPTATSRRTDGNFPK